MDDVLAQLRRQREKQKERDVDPSSTSSEIQRHASANKNDRARSMGGFFYDPILKRYLPRSVFKPNGNNDVCIQRIQQASIYKHESIDTKPKSINSSRLGSFGTVTDRDLRMVVFRGCCIKPRVASMSPRDRGYGRQKKRKKQSSNINIEGKQNNTDRRNNISVRGHEAPSAIHPLEEPHNATLPCSEKSIVLLASSLSYCSSTTRRRTIASTVAPLCIARRLEIVPTVATRDMLLSANKIGCIVTSNETSTAKSCTVGKPEELKGINHGASAKTNAVPPPNWFSMLHPINMARRREPYNHPWSDTVPLDCHCKSYLHPTASTFDISPVSDNLLGSSLPHVVTIAGEFLHYRGPVRIPPRGREAFQLGNGTRVEHHESWNANANFVTARELQLSDLPPGKIHSVRLALLGRDRNDDGVFVSCTIFDAAREQCYFALHSLDTSNTQVYGLPFEVNDFCFSPHKLMSPVVAFAHSQNGTSGVSFLDVETQTMFRLRSNMMWLDSDPICVQFRANENESQVLFGHRDGSVTMLDTRSTDAQFALLSGEDFGSVSSIQPLEKNEHLVVAKGSFGSCRVFDVRRLCNSKVEYLKKQQSSILTFLPPSIIHNTKSANCTGLAIHPTETVALAPFATKNNEVMAALWAIDSGKLLRTIRLDNASTTSPPSIDCPLFCELKSASTCGFRMSCTQNSEVPGITRESGAWGIWYKSMTLPHYSTTGIRHFFF
ncbi:hypothetical protein HJC23_001760 [Cyclotella cryptica]|uniref:Uncharacterized protein n=1 Tax=Cyclotella cryptica TaxID=29204 RepID=A0ABD3QQK0_9STRA|eukprot:CCRYP_003315-RA/>CCRYP_003315-RA protein AED:0.02 eAED:0.02 QI:84/0.5/0.66/1/1/1/3/40/721